MLNRQYKGVKPSRSRTGSHLNQGLLGAICPTSYIGADRELFEGYQILTLTYIYREEGL